MPKKEEKNELIEERKKIKGWANGLRIVSAILLVLSYIGIAFMGIILCAMPFFSKEIDIDEEKITFFGQKIEYKINEVDIIEFKTKDKTYNLNTKDIIKISKENFDLRGIKHACFALMFFAVAASIVEIIALTKITKLLKRMAQEDKVFVSGGSDTFKSLMILYIINCCIGFISAFTIAILLKTNSNININMSLVITALALYFVHLIFKYGESLEEK